MSKNQNSSEQSFPWSQPGILVGVDGSDAAQAAFEYAARLAPKLDLPLHALVVWDFPALAWGDSYGNDQFYEALADGAAQVGVAAAARAFPDGPPEWLTTSAHQGASARTLIEASRQAAMLVVGTRGHGGFAGLVLGSVSSACASHAQCPVLVVPDREKV